MFDVCTRRCQIDEKKLTFQNARDTAISMESAECNALSIGATRSSGTRPAVNRLHHDQAKHWNKSHCQKPVQSQTHNKCFQCIRKHPPETCRFKDATCHFCRKTGHITPACITRKLRKAANKKIHQFIGSEGPELDQLSSVFDNSESIDLFHIDSCNKQDPFLATVIVNNN